MTLTHSGNDEWQIPRPTSGPQRADGFRQDVVREMNRLGVIVDISHVSDKTFYDALAVSKGAHVRIALFLPRDLRCATQHDRSDD